MIKRAELIARKLRRKFQNFFEDLWRPQRLISDHSQCIALGTGSVFEVRELSLFFHLRPALLCYGFKGLFPDFSYSREEKKSRASMLRVLGLLF